ncbi:MAG: TolC family protein, partial [Tepidisphaeraceae bacterium]
MTSGPARYGIWRLARFSGHVLALGILISGTVLTGCAVDQEKEVAKYRAVLDADTRGAQDVAPGASISLTDALELANQHNERLTLQGEDYLQALIDKDRAFSNFLPTISLAPMYSVQDKAGGGNGGSSRRDRTDVPVEGSINLFNGFRDWNQLRRTAFTLEQQRALLLDLRATVLLDV